MFALRERRVHVTQASSRLCLLASLGRGAQRSWLQPVLPACSLLRLAPDVQLSQEDFEMAVAKVMKKDGDRDMSLKKLWK